MRFSPAVRLLAVLVTALSLVGCAAAAPYRTVALTFDRSAPATLGADPDEVRIAQVTARLMRERLGLPFPADTTVHFYVNQAAFAHGLVHEAGLPDDAAWANSRSAGGASYRGIFLRADRLASMTLVGRVSVIAHELAHMSQNEMRRGGRGGSARWIREGHADWVRFRVLEWLGLRPYEESRAEVRRSVLRSKTPIALFPSLADLTRGARWTEAHNTLGSAATYGQAFLAVDWLVERHGIEKLHQFLGRFALEADPRAHWAAVFGPDGAKFVQEFRAHLERLHE